jgi:hypothetical protein
MRRTQPDPDQVDVGPTLPAAERDSPGSAQAHPACDPP